MFLEKIIRRNPSLIASAVRLHQEGKLPPNSYVLDLDTIRENARIIADEAQNLGLKVYAMSKQIGRNPAFFKALAQGGIDAYVAVDMNGARVIHKAGYRIGHLGHLVQVPRAAAPEAAAMNPAYWTVFSTEKAQQAAAASLKAGHTQNLLARIQTAGDIFYMGHEGGFPAERIVEVADAIDALPGAAFAGITTFPALLYDSETRQISPTPNLKTLENAATALRKAGRDSIEINAPGTTSAKVMAALASAGATQVEPGHGLTGTTPLHAVTDLPETPAVVYLSEVSHSYQGHPYCFGGGLYIDPVFPPYPVRALVGRDAKTAMHTRVDATLPPPSAIDYYAILNPEEGQKISAGDSVIFGFRIQAFVTRAFVVPVSGISQNAPVVEGVWMSSGQKADWGTGAFRM